MSTWPVLVLGIYLGYLVYLSTWSTVLDPNPGADLHLTRIPDYAWFPGSHCQDTWLCIIPTISQCTMARILTVHDSQSPTAMKPHCAWLRGVMHSEASWPREACTHAQWVSWSRVTTSWTMSLSTTEVVHPRITWWILWNEIWRTVHYVREISTQYFCI